MAGRGERGERPELTVEVKRDGALLRRRYHTATYRHNPALDAAVTWDTVGQRFRFAGKSGLDGLASLLEGGTIDDLEAQYGGAGLLATGALLFDALFATGDARDAGTAPPHPAGESHLERVLRFAYGQGDGPPPRPVKQPVRLRVCTDDPVLTCMPWRTTAWSGRRLAESGWTFEVTGDLATGLHVLLKAPSHVLMLAPSVREVKGVPTGDHVAAVRAKLESLWADYAKEASGLFRVVRTRGEIVDAFAGMRPDILYYYGHAVSRDGSMVLLVDRAEGGEDPLTLADLRLLMGGNYPRVAFLNGCRTGQGGWQSAGHQLAPDVPMVLSHVTPAWSRHAATTALLWLERCLGEGRDPIDALHQRRPEDEHDAGQSFHWSTLTAHTSHKTWATTSHSWTVRRALGPYALDRRPQREAARALVSQLAQSDALRVGVIFAYGPPAMRVDKLSEQLRDYIESDARDIAKLRRVSMGGLDPSATDAPPARVRAALAEALDRVLGRGQTETREQMIRRWAPRREDTRRPVLWLDWDLVERGRELSLETVTAWLQFCAMDLEPACPKEVRVVAYLAKEIDAEVEGDLRLELQRIYRGLKYKSVRFADLPSLGTIDDGHLYEHLSDPRYCSCEPDLAEELSTLIHAATGGRYDATVTLLELGEAIGYLALRNMLRDQACPPHAPTLTKF